MNSSQAKKLAAAIGMGAVVAMGALTVAFSGQWSSPATVVSEPEITLGETATTTTGQTEVPTPVAEPPVIASTPEGMTPP